MKVKIVTSLAKLKYWNALKMLHHRVLMKKPILFSNGWSQGMKVSVAKIELEHTAAGLGSY